MAQDTPNPTPEQSAPLNSSCDSSSPNDRAEETACAAGLEDRLDECFDNAEKAAIELRGFADMLLAMPDRAELDCQWLGGKLVDILRMVERAWPGTADRILLSAALKQAGAAPAAAPAVIALPVQATAAPTPSAGDDSTIVAAFQRWLAALNEMTLGPGSDEAYDHYLAAVFEIMETPAAGAIGLALQGYILLNEEISDQKHRGLHDMALRLPTEEEDGELPARNAAGFFESVCGIIPDLKRLAGTRRDEVAMLDLTWLDGGVA